MLPEEISDGLLQAFWCSLPVLRSDEPGGIPFYRRHGEYPAQDGRDRAG